ncbi:MAG: hypothetical protein M1415_10715 [Firmicutes bacterium]|nr:hypothetical protein [Bacillota bacterium]MCL5065199.1 hypothetical protein [Bacillota bacterium]
MADSVDSGSGGHVSARGTASFALAAQTRHTNPPIWATAISTANCSTNNPPSVSLYESRDGGVNWTQLESGFTAFNVPSMLLATDGWTSEQTQIGTLWFGQTRNGGQTWTRYFGS